VGIWQPGSKITAQLFRPTKFIQTVVFYYSSVVNKSRGRTYTKKNAVSTAGGAETGNVYFSNVQIDERFNSLGYLRNPVFYYIFMLLFGFLTRNTPDS
jgi:hypothetical protein